MLTDPGFGRVFTDHMAIAQYERARAGTTRGSPRAAADHGSGLLGPPLCAGDFRGAEGLSPARTAARPCSGPTPMPAASTARRGGWPCPICRRRCSSNSIRALVRADSAWIPQSEDGALYLRPFMFASEVFLGVQAGVRYLYIVMASSVGAYFKGDARAISLWVTREYTRAGAGRHGRGEMRRQLRDQPDRPGRGDPQRLRPGRLPRRGRAALGRGAGRHEHLLRVRRRHRSRRRRSAARSSPASPGIRSSLWRATWA